VAARATGYRIVVDLGGHRLWVIDGNDTLRNSPVATAKNTTLSFGGKSWRFATPRGVRTVLSKDTEPTWTPPEWHYAEVAEEHGHYRLKLGDGYQIHGTPFQKSIGTSATHGCVRMTDQDIEWMYHNVPVGTKVYLY